MVVFALLFAVFVYYRAAHVPLFASAQLSLNQSLGALNTLLLLTGIHLLHVTIGMTVLAYLWQRLRSATDIDAHLSAVESGASFWHMVDILWILLFALVYLMR